MDEEIRVLPRKSLEKLTRTNLVASKALELSHRPRQERLIDVPEHWVQPRRGVSPVVLDPTPKDWIEPLGNISQGKLRPIAKVQLPNRRSHGFEGRDTGRRIESAKQPVIPATHNRPTSKTVPKKVKFDIRIGTLPRP